MRGSLVAIILAAVDCEDDILSLQPCVPNERGQNILPEVQLGSPPGRPVDVRAGRMPISLEYVRYVRRVPEVREKLGTNPMLQLQSGLAARGLVS